VGKAMSLVFGLYWVHVFSSFLVWVLLLLPLGVCMVSFINSNVFVVPVCGPLPGNKVVTANFNSLVFNQKHFHFIGFDERVRIE
jgi:hypothetical protein